MASADSTTRWWALGAMSGALAMVLIDETVVGVALPTIVADLGLGTIEGQWVINAYLLALAALTMLGGRLADLAGLRLVFLAGLGAFAAGSAAVGLAGDGTAAIASRAAQGAGGALMIPASLAIVFNAFPESERGRALGIYSGLGVIALSIGPLLGGVLTDLASWRWVFWINVPLAAAVGAVAAVAVRQPRSGSRRGGVDLAGLALLVPGLCALVLGIMQAEAWGWGSAFVVALLAGGLLVLAAFAAVELRRRDPLIDVRLFARAQFLGGSLGLLCAQLAGVSVSIYAAIYLQDELSFSALVTGVALIPAMLPSTVMSLVGGRLVDRSGPRPVLWSGAAGSAAGFGLMTLGVAVASYPILAGAFVVFAIGIPLVFLGATAAALDAVETEQRGEASGVAQTCQQVGGTLGIAVLGAVLAGLGGIAGYAVVFALCALVMVAAVAVALLVLPARSRVAEALA